MDGGEWTRLAAGRLKRSRPPGSGFFAEPEDGRERKVVMAIQDRELCDCGDRSVAEMSSMGPVLCVTWPARRQAVTVGGLLGGAQSRPSLVASASRPVGDWPAVSGC